MTEFDLAAAALVLVCAYGGYRRGLVVFVLYLAGGLLALGLAAVIAPLAAPWVAGAVNLPAPVARPLLVVLFTGVLRLVIGYALRELAATLRTMLHAVPPLALLDRLLGIVPGAALGVVAVLALTLAALTLPVGGRLHDAAAASWLARSVVTRPQEALTTLRRLWEGLVATPPDFSLIPLASGVSGLWLGAFAALRLRRARERSRFAEAPTLRTPRPAPGAQVETADSLALPRALLGIAAAGAMMAALVVVSTLRG